MCGIAGIIGRVDGANQDALRRMSRALSHRGPDGEGFWASTPDERGHGCLLAHRRLSILDLSHAADQPMVDVPTGQVLIFNGEIYNYRELRDELAAAGESFHSTGDTEVMLRVLARGAGSPDAVAKLRGMFAFALWDPAKRELLLARDPLGIKPLYVAANPDTGDAGEWSLVFASEVRAILASGLLGKPRLDPDAVASVVWNGFVMGPGTAVRGVESLDPGEMRVVDARGAAKFAGPFWTMPQAREGDASDDAAWTDELERALQDCVRLHLVSDVPLGVFLSGGIDSSAVANLAQRASPDRKVNTFTLAFEEASHDESPHARRVAEAIGSEHYEIVLTEARFIDGLCAAMDGLDQPSFDALNSYFVSRAVREAGLTVAVAGTGGDELFGGYRSFAELPVLQRWNRRTRWVPGEAKAAAIELVRKVGAARGAAVAPQTRWAKLPEIARAGDDLLRLYQLAYALFLPGFQRELLDGTVESSRTVYGLTPAMRARLADETRDRSVLAAVSVMEQRCFLGERLLRDTDSAGMAVSLETRLPLVDQVLIGHVNRLPERLRFHPVGRKQFLRTIGLRGLDPALFERPKRGFVLPIEHWLRRRLGAEMDATMRDGRLVESAGLSAPAVERLWRAFQEGAPGMYWSRAWAIFVLVDWCKRNGVFV